MVISKSIPWILDNNCGFMKIIKVMNLIWQAHHAHAIIRNSQNSIAPTASQMVLPNSSYACTLFILWVCQDLMVIMFQNHQARSPLTSLVSQLQEMDYSILDTPSLTPWSKEPPLTLLPLLCLGNKPGLT